MREQVLKLDPSRPYQVEGNLFAIWLPRGRGKVDAAYGLVGNLTGCPNPACHCTDITLTVLLVDDRATECAVTPTSLQVKGLIADGPELKVQHVFLDFFTGVVSAKDHLPLPDDLQPFFQAPLPGWLLDHAYDYWIELRPKAKIDWKTRALKHWARGELLSRMIAWPERRHDRYVIDGKTYQADTHFCIEPDCDCNGAQFVVMELRDQTLVQVASARLPLATMRPENVRTNDECPESVFPKVFLDWTARHAPADAALLAMREETRRRGTELLTLANPKVVVGARVSSVPVPRNAPCPCGSGKKYKRCCGAQM